MVPRIGLGRPEERGELPVVIGRIFFCRSAWLRSSDAGAASPHRQAPRRQDDPVIDGVGDRTRARRG